MIRFAVIGTNFITTWFLDVATLVPEMEFYGVYSRSLEKAESFGQQYGARKFYDNLDDLAADPEIDAVYLASPNRYHCEQAVLLMNAGKHVLCEKPIATNTKEFIKMKEAAKANNVVLLEAMRTVIDPGFRVLKENIKKIGKVRQATFQFCQYSSRYDKFKKGIIENAFKPELSNGALMDIGVYCVHTLVKLFGLRIQ